MAFVYIFFFDKVIFTNPISNEIISKKKSNEIIIDWEWLWDQAALTLSGHVYQRKKL